ncbi:MAG: LysE family transporter [Rhodobacteraceae bacterium]|nr:LysE family transporter [Paracoccaceae bacterium]
MTLPIQPFLSVWTVLAVNVLSPGPNVLNTMMSAMGSGRAAGLASALGVALGVGLWCLAMTLGMAALFEAVPAARQGLTGLAVALLAWFAARYLRAAWNGFRGGQGRIAAHAGLGPRASFLRSLSVNATNPKALTTWVVILSIFPVAHAAPADIAVLCLGASLIAFGIHAGYALAFSTGPALGLWRRIAPAISAAVGLFFLGFAARLAIGLLHSGG